MPSLTFLEPDRVWTRAEVLARPCPVPPEPGVYAWFISGLPVPTDTCHSFAGFPLVYVGIAPSRPNSKANLRRRIKQHFRGNASGSTLRMSVGCLLSDSLGIELQPVGRRLHFAQGEVALNTWLDHNARVCWVSNPAPWKIESDLIGELDLPLNLQHNSTHPFHARLSALRKETREKARRLL